MYQRPSGTTHYENKICSILSSAHTWASFILAGKCDSQRHSTTGFSENVVVAKISNVRSFNHFPIKLGLTSFNNNNRASLVKKVWWSFPGCLIFFLERPRPLKISIVLLTTRNTLALSWSSCKLRIGSNLQLSCTWRSGPEIHNYSIRPFHRPCTETFPPPLIYCFLGCHSVFFEDPIQCLSRLLLRPLSV